ncbi:TonB C-terminal domain-containing protein [Myxococcota bacterium]|nr:TonB C-terminal domain-containing protein [Myxococcota bacterium]
MIDAARGTARDRRGERLAPSLAASVGLHVGLVAVSLILGRLGGGERPPPMPPTMIVEPLYALPRDPGQLPDRPQSAPPPEAGQQGEEEPPDPRDAMVLPDPATPKERGTDVKREEREELERKKREALERMAKLEPGTRDVAPTSDEGLTEEDWVWNPSGKGSSDPVLGRYVAQVRNAIIPHFHVVNRGVLKDSPDFYVGVTVRIDRKGTVLEYRITRGSGSAPFDSYARSAMRKTQQGGGLPAPDDAQWQRLSGGRQDEVLVDVQFAARDMSLQ